LPAGVNLAQALFSWLPIGTSSQPHASGETTSQDMTCLYYRRAQIASTLVLHDNTTKSW